MEEILIVDDMPEQITYASELLKQEGYRVFAALDGYRALDFLQKHKPQLIVLDIKMSGLSGIEVCKKIKEINELKDIPVIFVTSDNRQEIIRQGFIAGCCDYVLKPYVKEEFLARVKAHIKIYMQSIKKEMENRELDMFCSSVSHDLRSPLQSMDMLIKLLKENVHNNELDEINELADMIDDKSNKIILMINRLLEFSRMCNISVNIKRVDLNNLFCGVFNDLKKMENNKNIELIVEPLDIIDSDEVLIEMAVKNILSNAIKFSRHKKNPTICVYQKKENGVLYIYVKDNGAGFDMEYADKIFDIFTRLHDDREFEGSGVGLALVKRIMKRLGGDISIEGKINEGALVCLKFFL